MEDEELTLPLPPEPLTLIVSLHAGQKCRKFEFHNYAATAMNLSRANSAA